MIKTRLGLFSGVFLIVVGTAHSWPQRVAAVCIEPGGGGLCFDGFVNQPIGSTAELTIDANANLLVFGLQFTPPSSAGRSACNPPGSGDEITPDDPHDAGNRGYSVHLKDTKIPDDTTAYFVELDGYWGTKANTWNTSPLPPIGFTENNGTITACADFNVTSLGCTHVLVEFKAGSSGGTVKCPAGDLFTVGAPIILQKIVAHGTCPGNSCDGDNEDQCDARQKTMLEFSFKSPLDFTVVQGCTDKDGNTLTAKEKEFNARSVLIQPDLRTCAESCPSADRAIDAPVSRGGNTPPIRMVRLLAAESSGRSGARVDGSFVITKEFLGDIPTVGTWGLVVMVQLVLVAGTVVFRRRLPMISAF